MIHVVKINVFCLVLLLGNLRAVPGETTGSYQPTLCKTHAVTIGEIGVMEFSISPKINLTEITIIDLRRSDDPAGINLLTCDAMDNKSTISCVVNNDNFTTKGVIGRTLTVRIPNAKNELDAKYELMAFVNGNSIVLSSCNFTVLTKGASSGAVEPTSKVKTIVVPICVLVVVGAIVIAVIFFLRRRNRNKQSGSKATPENDKLNKTTETTGISDTDIGV